MELIKLINEQLKDAFEKAGYDPGYAVAVISNRPDLCEYQCNGALPAAKKYKKAPMVIAQEVAAFLEGNDVIASVNVCNPGFINMDVREDALSDILNSMGDDERLACEKEAEPKKIIIDYGGANVAKPLHVGHLRSAIIGESIKRMLDHAGHEAIGDVHLGDWGLQMGLIICEIRRSQPDLPYFDQEYKGEYPKEAPFTISELEQIYPTASARSKEDPAFKEEAMAATYELQQGRPGYIALWEHILRVSVEDLKKNYDALDVHFELWKKESDAQPYIPDMVQRLKDDGFAHLDQGALVVDVKEETDTKEIPPCMILKSDGSSLYNTTDLATLVMRRELYDPDEVIYVVDKRQELYFTQVFRCARKTGIVDDKVSLKFLGFGTMNGRDGKPFKTREGGVMRLEHLIADINNTMYEKIMGNHEADPKEAKETAKTVALSAIKYGDLSNQASKDYIFDLDKFTSFEGNTGPYILYTMVRIKSILTRYREEFGDRDVRLVSGSLCGSDSEKKVMLTASRFPEELRNATADLAPHKLCSYIYELADEFNRFYHETNIMKETDPDRRDSWIALLKLVLRIMEKAIYLLGFQAPDRM